MDTGKTLKLSKASIDSVHSTSPGTVHKIEIHLLEIHHCFQTRLNLVFPNTLPSTTMSSKSNKLKMDQKVAVLLQVSCFHHVHRFELLKNCWEQQS